MIEKGRLIVVEGPDLFGKSLQVSRLEERLQQEQLPVQQMRFPSGNSSVSPQLDAYLASGNPLQDDPYAVAALFIQDRLETAPVITAKLAQGTSIILSRYWPSTWTYQGQFMPPSEVEQFWAWAASQERGLPDADVTLVLTGDIQVVQDSLRTREVPKYLSGTGKVADVHESNLDLQRNCDRLYRQIASRYQWPVVEATEGIRRRTPDEVAAEIWGRVAPLFNN